MATFAYKARDERGLLVQGNIEAASQREAMTQLDAMGYIPVSAKETGSKGTNSIDDFLLRFQRVKHDDLIFFTLHFKQLYVRNSNVWRVSVPLKNRNDPETDSDKNVRGDRQRFKPVRC